MYFAIDKNAMRVHISDADSNAHYKCPACGSPLTIKRGSIVAHHFSHKKRVQCDPVYASKMSLWHQNMQNKFPRIAQEIIVWNHNKSKFRIADALISSNDGSYVFEFQHSSISADEFISKSSFYLSLGHRVIWIFNFTDCCHPKCLFY